MTDDDWASFGKLAEMQRQQDVTDAESFRRNMKRSLRKLLIEEGNKVLRLFGRWARRKHAQQENIEISISKSEMLQAMTHAEETAVTAELVRQVWPQLKGTRLEGCQLNVDYEGHQVWVKDWPPIPASSEGLTFQWVD